MLALIIVYFLILTGLVTLDCVAMIVTSKRPANFTPCNFLRYARALEMVMAIYLVTVLELVVYLANNLTIGFVKVTTIIFSVVALVYIIDFAYTDYKLKDYVLIVSKLPNSAFAQDSVKDSVKYKLQDIYIRKDSLATVEESLREEKAKGNFTKRVLMSRIPMIAILLLAMIASIVAVALI